MLLTVTFLYCECVDSGREGRTSWLVTCICGCDILGSPHFPGTTIVMYAQLLPLHWSAGNSTIQEGNRQVIFNVQHCLPVVRMCEVVVEEDETETFPWCVGGVLAE